MPALKGVGLLKGLGVTFKTMTRPAATRQYPHVKPDLPARTRGVIALIHAAGRDQPRHSDAAEWPAIVTGELYHHENLLEDPQRRGHRCATTVATAVFVHPYVQPG